MTDEKEVHQKLGDHGARLNNLESTVKSEHKTLHDRVSKIDERHRRDIRWLLTSVIVGLLAVISGIFKWVGQQFGNLAQ
jgi:hypothetical protein